jgi:DNA-binding response OmpR family regulator
MSLNIGTTNKILIIEPDARTREMLVEVFKKNNFEVLEATDGADGFSKANDEVGLSVVLTALNMPRIDGEEFLKRKKEDLSLRDIPVIIHDNLSDEEEREMMLSLGAKDFIVKGTVAPDQLVQRVSRAMQQGDYFFQIDPYALDAQEFINDHHLSGNFKCINCGSTLALKIGVNREKKMQASVVCPECGEKYL